MRDRVEEALERHAKGYNCCQAVACVFAEELGYKEDTVFRLAEGFGAGMGGMQCTCGAVSGAVMVAGMKNSTGAGLPKSKGATYKLSKDVVESFRQKNDSVICSELKGIETRKVLRSCDGCIEDAVRIAEKVLGL
ncbi:MAG: C-GCAxxG-C-C family protein [Lachnospiraceae bacterium]|nr:C-GCAxxG-C-C family protein [Lachnospiraceae bacterium]